MTARTEELSPAGSAMHPLEVVQRIQAKMGNVKMLPDVAVRALAIVQDPEASVKQFAEVIRQDARLATSLLAMANSVLYSGGHSISNLDAGIARIGFRQSKNLIIATSLASVMKELSLEEEWIHDSLWRHSLTTGVIATHLNRTLQAGFDGEEFTAGLVHDFGRTLLAVGFPKEFASIDPLDFDESGDVLEHENELIGTNHCDVGAWFVKDQGLPAALQEAIRFHHDPGSAKEFMRLVALTATADHMANHHARSGELNEYDPRENPGPKFLEQSGVQDAVNRFNIVAADVLALAVQDAAEMAFIA